MSEATKIDLVPGTRVQCHGLKTGKYNGMQGVIEHAHQEVGRWQVKLDSGQRVKIKPDNLKAPVYEMTIKHEKYAAMAWSNLGCQGGGIVEGMPYTANQCFEMAIKHEPHCATAWYNLGFLGGGTVEGRTHTGTQCYEMAIKVKPDDASAWNNLGCHGGGTVVGTPYTAKQCFEMAIKHEPDDASAWHNLGNEGGGTAESRTYTAKQCYDMAIKLKPDDASVFKNLCNEGGGTVEGTTYTAKQCYDMAIKHRQDGDWQSDVNTASGPQSESIPTCVVCLSEEATLVGKRCGHLAWCASCRRNMVHVALGGKGSKRKLSAAQLDRTLVDCPVCRVQTCIVRYEGRAWRRAGNYEVFVP